MSSKKIKKGKSVHGFSPIKVDNVDTDKPNSKRPNFSTRTLLDKTKGMSKRGLLNIQP